MMVIIVTSLTLKIVNSIVTQFCVGTIRPSVTDFNFIILLLKKGSFELYQ